MRAWTSAAVLASFLVAAEGYAANLVEVRVGSHAEFTRVVLETDAPVRYELSRNADGELRVRLFATATPRRLGSKSPVLREVVVESDAAGAIAHLALKKRGAVDVKEMVLDNPPRIVLDLTPRAGGAPAPEPKLAKVEPAPVPVPTRAPAPRAEPAPAEPPAEAVPSEPEPARAEVRPEAQPEPQAGQPEPEPEPEAAAAEPREADLEAAREAAAQAELDRLAGIAPPPREEPAPAPAEAAAAEPVEEPAAAAPAGTEAGGSDLAAAEGYEVDEPAEVGATPPAQLAPPPGALSFLPSPLDDPLVLGVISTLLLLVALLALLRSRSGRRVDTASLASPFASGEAFAYAGAGPAQAAGASSDAEVGPLFASAAAQAQEQEGAAPSIFDVAEDAAAQDDYEPEVAPYADPGIDAAPSATTSYKADSLEGDDMRVIEELERRLAHLETRLEEVVDAKERLERHVAAQTEELRVQRAAIARTQRVLRTVVKPDDLATEPAPKV